VAALICPDCQAEIPDEDFNVSTDIAYCRQCGANHGYSEIVDRDGLNEVELGSPPRWLQIIPGYQGEVLQYKKISPVVFFLLFFELFWTGMLTVFLIGGIGEEGHDQSFLFFLPFIFVSAVLLLVILFMLLGKRTIEVGNFETVIKNGWGGFSLKKSFNNNDFKSVYFEKGSVSVNNVRQDDICVALEGGNTIRFGALIEKSCKKYIAAYLKSKLA